MAWKSYQKESRKEWGAEIEPGKEISREQIMLGAILRIADGVEKMVQIHTDLILERDRYEKWYRNEVKNHQTTANSLRVTKGHLTRAKNRIKELETQLAEKEQKNDKDQTL